MILYVDTSALIELYIEEENREFVRAAVMESELVGISTVGYAEARAALARKRREGNLDDNQQAVAISNLNEDWLMFSELIVYHELAHFAGELAQRYGLRGFDAIHLASAMYFTVRYNNLQLLAFDSRLINAARDASLTIYGDHQDSLSHGER